MKLKMKNKIKIIGLILIVIIGIIFILNMFNDKTMDKPHLEGDFSESIFAGGCFWCVESDFEKLPGVIDVVSGYSGGDGENPNYEDYISKGHIEVVKVIYNETQVSYEELLEYFWMHIDPLDDGGQFCDRGYAYSSAIFYQNSNEEILAKESKKKVEEVLSGKVATSILELNKFFKAENYHQDYYEKNSLKYTTYRRLCGRDNRVEEVWGNKVLNINDESDYSDFIKPSDEELKEMLSDIQYKVTQKDGTEPSYRNEYWDNEEEGIYVDIVSGETLFSSKDKFVSGTGWPSFTKPISSKAVVEKEDDSLFLGKRIEVRSKYADSHLGHVFDDGPNGSLRYCMNSAALSFIPKDKLAENGYEEYLELFE